MKLENFFKEQIDGEIHTLLAPPHNYAMPDGRTIINFHLNPEAMTSQGWREWTDEELEAWHAQYDPAPVVPDETDFLAACQQFKEVCNQIGEAIGKPDFRGGFDEMTEFRQSEIFATTAGLQLAVAWSAANEYAKYEGSKLGYGQPQWWYRCWQLLDAEA